jgi:GNAT superfamily N-acetyltransferase
VIIRPLVRPGRVEERLALEDLQRRAWAAWPDLRELLLANPDLIALARASLTQGCVTVADDGGKALGFSVVAMRPGFAQLEGLFVEPSHWRQGIGRTLAAAARQELAAQGGGRLQTVANPRAEGFYARLGFVPDGMAMTVFGPARRMLLDVAGTGGNDGATPAPCWPQT